MELHTCLWSNVSAFDFKDRDFLSLRQSLPHINLVVHDNAESFLSQSTDVQNLLTWEFPESWYGYCPNLELIMTPAAGQDWIAQDPKEKTRIVHGTFHGGIMAESVLSALLYMNHRMPDMQRNHAARGWDRNLQKDARLLRNQKVVIIGFGSIGEVCGRLIQSIGADVTGVRRSAPGTIEGIEICTTSHLPELLPTADHVVLVLPGDDSTDNFLTPELISLCKPGVYLYNFGRGNALTTATLEQVADQIGGAFLDVTDVEPLPVESVLWQKPNIMITPHSSCIYQDYKISFLQEVIEHLKADPAL